ncbi:Pr6Pr family membrane protein [Actinoplanes sp. G11-F43]|uniref:Pr6Pr family membrane protein n=1 Tax=Actinoplanes sp. G11-F43 TaxID=3424130 RepID=UPI003D326E78
MGIHASPQWWWRLSIVVAGVSGLYTADYGIVAYTTQSSIAVIVYYAGVLYWMHRRVTVEAAAPRLRAAVLSWVLLSGVVLHFVLAGGRSPLPGVFAGDAGEISSFLVHYVLPAMVLADWAVFRPFGTTRWPDLFAWTLFPLGYAAIALLRGALGFRYPYRFLDPTYQGWSGVGLWILLLAAGFLLIGALLIGVDRSRRRSVIISSPD